MECCLIVVVLWVFSVCLHEFGHAWAAYQGGDYTVKDKGYLTLNPVNYTEPVTSLLLPVVFMMMGGIGLPGGAVYIEKHLLRSKMWESWVAIAGPVMNLVIIGILSMLFRFGVVPLDPESLASVSLALLLQLQVSAVLLNLLPVPPLDGFQAIAPWLRPDLREQLFAMSNQTLWILFLVLWFVPPANHAFWWLVYFISDACGVPPELGYAGWHAFRFWKSGGT